MAARIVRDKDLRACPNEDLTGVVGVDVHVTHIEEGRAPRVKKAPCLGSIFRPVKALIRCQIHYVVVVWMKGNFQEHKLGPIERPITLRRSSLAFQFGPRLGITAKRSWFFEICLVADRLPGSASIARNHHPRCAVANHYGRIGRAYSEDAVSL